MTKGYRKRFITINTDASHCDKTNAGGWAVWITTTDGRIKQYGAFKESCSGSDFAECGAIINALHILHKSFDGLKFDHVVFNTDSMAAIEVFTTEKAHKGFHKEFRRLFKEVMPLIIKKFELKSYRFKHCRAHTKEDNARSKVNDWCDKAARKSMREKRDSIKQNQRYNNMFR